MKMRRLVVYAAVFVLGLQRLTPALAGTLEDTLAGDDWAAIRAALAEDRQDGGAREVVARGYAALANNNYTEASRAFAALGGLASEEWTDVASLSAEACRQHPNSWVVQLLDADIQARCGDYTAASASATKAIDTSRGAALAYHLRGVVHAMDGNVDLALKDLSAAVERDPSLADTYVARSIVRLGSGDANAAQNDAEAALHVAPFFATASNVRGVALCRKGSYEDALKAFAYALDLEPNHDVAQQNIEAARFLASSGRARMRVSIVAGHRAGAMGRRTLVVVAASDDRRAETEGATAAALKTATGLPPLLVRNVKEGLGEWQKGQHPVVLSIVASQAADAIRQTLEVAPNDGGEGGVRIVTQGETAAATMAEALNRVVRSHSDNGVRIACPRWPEDFDGWDIIDFTPADVDLGLVITAAAHLRAMGVHVNAYGGKDFLNSLAESVPPGAKIPIALYPVPRSAGPTPYTIHSLYPQMATSWMTPSERSMSGGFKPCLFASSRGDVGAFAALPDLTPAGLKPGGSSVPAGDGLLVGSSKGGTPQIVVITGDQAVQVRIDVDNPHGQKPHVNVEAGGKNRHSDRNDDGGPSVLVGSDDEIKIRVGGGKLTIEVNGQKVKEYDVPEAGNDEEIEIRRNPDGTTTVSQGGKPVGGIVHDPDGSTTIKVGGTVINVPPTPTVKGQPSDSDKGVTGSDSQSEAGKSACAPPRIRVRPNGEIEILDPDVVPMPRIPELGPDVLPEPHTPELGPDVLPVPPDRNAPGSFSAPTSRGGVYTVDAGNLEIGDSATAGTEMLFGRPRTDRQAVTASLQCSFLIFPGTATQGKE